MNDNFTDVELRMQVNVLRAEVKTLAGGYEVLRDKHNVLLEAVGVEFRRSKAASRCEDWPSPRRSTSKLTSTRIR